MKLIKIKIKRESKDGGTNYSYPTPYYDSQKVRFGPIYEASIDETIKKIKSEKRNYEFIILGIDDSDLDQFLEINGKEIDGFNFESQEVSKEQAHLLGVDWFGDKWDEDPEVVLDPDKVISILGKKARSLELTKDEEDMLDPNIPGKGIVKKKSIKKKLDEFVG